MANKSSLVLRLLKWLDKMTKPFSERANKQLLAASFFIIIYGLIRGASTGKDASWVDRMAVVAAGISVFNAFALSHSLLMGTRLLQKQIRKSEQAKQRGESLLTFLLSDAELQASLGDIDEEYPERLEYLGASAGRWRARQVASAHLSAAKRKIIRLVSKARVRF